MHYPLKFADFSAEKEANYCGYGLKSINQVPKGEVLFKMSL